MPRYDYRCVECGHEFTVTVSISDKDKVACPDCGDKNIAQLFTGCMMNTGAAPGCGSECEYNQDWPFGQGCGCGPGCGCGLH